MTHTFFLITVFLAASLACYAVISLAFPSAVRKRLESLEAAQPRPEAGATGPVVGAIARWLESLAKPSSPRDTPDASFTRVRFHRAGLRSPSAPLVYFGVKTLLTFAFPAILLVYVGASSVRMHVPTMLAALLFLAAVGYYLPNVALARMIARRQRDLFEAFPDALDLMRVCVEAGLSLDAAIERVGEEMRLESAALAEEFHFVSLELRAGASRAEALRNLALRVSLEDIDGLVSMLVQADRFGTSIIDALRVHSDALRAKRQLAAEECAARLPVKLLIPLIFCIFPALLTVLLGPAFISVSRVLMPTITGR